MPIAYVLFFEKMEHQMKPLYKIMAILSVFTNTSYAVDAISFCASKGSVLYSLIRKIDVWGPKQKQPQPQHIPIVPESRCTTLDAVDSITSEDEGSDEGKFSATEKFLATFDRIPGVPDETISDTHEDLLLGSLPRSYSLGHRRLFRTTSFAEAPVGAIAPIGLIGLASSDQEEILLQMGCPGQDVNCGDDEVHSFALTYPGNLSVVSNSSDSPVETEIDMESDFPQGATASSITERAVVITPAFIEVTPRWIPGENVTVAFVRNNRKVVVVWGGRFERHKTISGFARENPPRCHTPLTPINQVLRRSVIEPGSRSAEVRLREAKLNCLLPIQFETNPRTKEEAIKVVPRFESSVSSEIET